MSPGVTFERVYNELKRMLAEGELAPGTPIEPALIGKRIASSITPVRDALHRLTGERLVEAPNHNGFRVPLPTEAGLRDLYQWTDQVLRLAARRRQQRAGNLQGITPSSTQGATSVLFLEIARCTGSAEHVRVLESLNDRLAPFRRVETRVLDDIATEYRMLLHHHEANDSVSLARAIGLYHRRRMRVTGAILGAIARS